MAIFFAGSAIISVMFLKENLRASDLLGEYPFNSSNYSASRSINKY